jgi:hypothetical protein
MVRDAFADAVEAGDPVPFGFGLAVAFAILEAAVVASETVVIEAPDWVVRTSGLLPTKPTRVTVFFMIATFRSCSNRPRDHPFD